MGIFLVFVTYTNTYVFILTIVVYMVAAIPIHVILSHAGIPIALKNNIFNQHSN